LPASSQLHAAGLGARAATAAKSALAPRSRVVPGHRGTARQMPYKPFADPNRAVM